MNSIKKKFNKKNGIKAAAIVLTGTVLCSAMIPLAASAATPNTPKEEVIYINLNSNGSVKEINAVNIFNLVSDGKITDYGNYESVRNMTTTDEIDCAGDTVTIDAKAGQLYYEGKLRNKLMPWDISIHYYMDGTEYTADEIAGKSGKLKITVSIRKNTQYEGNFFDSYALQASLTLDTKKCCNISADGATVANVGSDKQLTYTVLPGNEIDLTVTAEVVDFEMSGISINAIPLSLNIEVDDTELMNQVTELLNAINQLDDGATALNNAAAQLQSEASSQLQGGSSDLNNGASQLQQEAGKLKDGGSSVNDGAADIKNGAEQLDNGINALNEGIVKIQTGLNTLNEKSSSLTDGSAQIKAALLQVQTALNDTSLTTEDLTQLTQASSEIKRGIDNLVSGVQALQQSVSSEGYKAAMKQNGLDVDELKQQNSQAIAGLQSTITSLKNQLSALEQAGADTSEIQAQITQLENVAALLSANNSNIDGTQTYLDTVNQNIAELLSGAQTLQTNYASFDTQLGLLVDSLSNLAYNMSNLSDAINKLVDEYAKLDEGISDYTGGVAEILAGYSQVTSGATALVNGSSELKNGTTVLYQGTSELLAGIVEFYNATGSLSDGTGKLDDGVAELLAGIAQLYNGTSSMKNGTSSLRSETSGLDDGVSEKIDELMDSITGGDLELESFVSDKNTNIEAVQFVIRTESISVEEVAEESDETEVKMGFVQKLLNLFGID
ncbi:MAG: hypothetical protein ACI4IJ_00325 [Acutalibacteraceae bacterium]